ASDSLASTDRRVSSPSAAKIAARVLSARGPLWRRLDMLRDVLALRATPAVIHGERFEPPLAWDLVEARFDHAQHGPAGGRPQRELDQRRRLGRIILAPVGPIWSAGGTGQPAR